MVTADLVALNDLSCRDPSLKGKVVFVTSSSYKRLRESPILSVS